MAQPIPPTVDGRLEAARTLKLEGNDFFKKQDWRKAISKYHRAKLYCKGITDKLDFLPGLESLSGKTKPTEEQKREASELVVAVSNNLAGIVLKFGECTISITNEEAVGINVLFKGVHLSLS